MGLSIKEQRIKLRSQGDISLSRPVKKSYVKSGKKKGIKARKYFTAIINSR